MSLNRVAGPASSAARCHQSLLWLVVTTLLPFLLTQVLPEQTTMSLGPGSSAWEDAEDDGGDNVYQGYRAATFYGPCAEQAPARLPEAGAVVVRPAASRQAPRLVARSPRGPPENWPDTKNRASSNVGLRHQPPSAQSFTARVYHENEDRLIRQRSPNRGKGEQSSDTQWTTKSGRLRSVSLLVATAAVSTKSVYVFVRIMRVGKTLPRRATFSWPWSTAGLIVRPA
jgi:hypothetical protein